MIVLITGASHTGKTVLAQKLLEKYRYPYLSIDQLKMGLIRSGTIALTPMSDAAALTACLWPIVSEMIRTAIENGQNLIVEGCYIPFDWQRSFSSESLAHIKFLCLIMSEQYIEQHFDAIKGCACVIERRLDDSYCTLERVTAENRDYLKRAKESHANYILIDDAYQIDVDL